MLINGIWTWVADPDAVKEAVEAVHEAENDALEAHADFVQEQREQAIEEFQDSIGKMKDVKNLLTKRSSKV
jgi:vacuolar-type H+-ATPase subunit H